MKSYPSIQNSSKAPRKPCIAFVKYDGSNFRAEYAKGKWGKFGLRNRLFDESDKVFGPAIPIFLDKYAVDLEKIFKKEKVFRSAQNITVYGEYFGSLSFAGNHKPWDKKKDVIIFDVNIHKRGFMLPQDFLKTFGHLQVAEEVYRGNLNEEFIQKVRDFPNSDLDISSKYDTVGSVVEGVVCKGTENKHNWMCKIKTKAYFDALKEKYEDDWIKYWE